MQLLNRSLRLDYAGYYDRLNGWKRKNIEFREGELDESLLYKYCGLWMNDQIYRLLMEIEKHLTDSGLYRREAKHHFLEAKKEMRRYNALLPSRHNLSDERFAEVMQNMEDLLKPSLDILCFSVSQQLLHHDLTGELNSLLSKIVVVGMLSAANKVIVEHFRKETARLVGVPSPHLDFLYMERLKDDMSRLDAALFPTLQGIDLTESGEVMKAFNGMVRKMTSKGEFRKAIKEEK